MRHPDTAGFVFQARIFDYQITTERKTFINFGSTASFRTKNTAPAIESEKSSSFVLSKIMTDNRDKILRNAHSLAEDAQLLLENCRYARAFAISILSIEETGKYALLTMKTHGIDIGRGKLNYHKQKQIMCFSLLLAEKVVSKIDSWLEQFDLDWIEIQGQKILSPEGEKQMQKIIEKNRNILVEDIAPIIASTGFVDTSELARVGGLDYLKQSSFYVDDEFVEHGLEPSKIPKELAEAYVAVAFSAANHIERDRLMNVASTFYASALKDALSGQTSS